MTTRRPIKARGAAPVRELATRLTRAGATPNRISQASVAFAALALLGFWAAAWAGPAERFVTLIGAALCIQGRLMCNLLDGMVAVEGGRSAPDGPFWNEAPDRVADILILGGLGLAAHAPALGLLAAALAVCTAYLRELGRAEGLAPDFSGPLAKPQRMAVATVAAVLAAVVWPWSVGILQLALWVLVIGTGITVVLRSSTIVQSLSRR